jgi:hypothetical protein
MRPRNADHSINKRAIVQSAGVRSPRAEQDAKKSETSV